jgi:TfoX/Sxy family transcriptional regulator of competence genes
MSTSTSQFEFIFDQLSFVPKLRSRKMFGEYGIYSGDKHNQSVSVIQTIEIKRIDTDFFEEL